MKILENDSTKVQRAIRRLQSVKEDIEEAISYLQSEHSHKDATCAMAADLYKSNDLPTALADDALASSKLTESDQEPEDASESSKKKEMTDEEFEKAWAAIGFHGGGGVYSAEEFMRKFKEAQKLL